MMVFIGFLLGGCTGFVVGMIVMSMILGASS